MVVSEFGRSLISDGGGVRISRRDALWLAAGTLIVPVLVAWPDRVDAAALAREPMPGGDLIVAYNAEPPNLDPHLSPAFLTSRVTELTYNGLVRYNAAFAVEPDLATGWKISDDRLTYSFELRPNVVFHSGRPLTADDVVYSFERIRNAPNTNRSALLGSLAGVTATDERNVTFTLNAPYAPFLANLATPGMYVVAKEAVEAKGGLDSIAVGTGPFTFVEWVSGSHIKLAKNPAYFETGTPYLDSITMSFVTDESARSDTVRSGDAHIAVSSGSAGSAPDRDGRIMTVRVPNLNFHVIGFRTDQQPFDDVRVRQAISLCINRQELIAAAPGSEGEIAGPVPPALTEWALPTDELPYYEHDVDRARTLLAEAGYADGFTTTIMTSPAYQEMVSDAQIVQSQLQAIGIDLTIEQEAWDVYVGRWLRRDFAMYAGINGQYSDDPDYSLYPALHTGEPLNVSAFSNAEVDRLLEAGRTAEDVTTRKEIYDLLQPLLTEQAPLIWTYSGMISDAVSVDLNGYYVLPNESRASLRSSWLASAGQE